MESLPFYVLGTLLLAAGSGVIWLKHPIHAAYALLATMLVGTALIAWLHAEFLALALLLTLVASTALILTVGLPWLASQGVLTQTRPDEDRSFWAGIVALLFFVITYRVLATTSWGAEDHSGRVLTEAQRGLGAMSVLGETLRSEAVLPLIAGALLVGATLATAAALLAPETDA